MNLNKDGFEIRKKFVSNSIIQSIKDEVSSPKMTTLKSGIRGADKKFKSVKELAYSQQFLNDAAQLLGSTPSVIRILYFDKTPDINWLVSWHQDKTIAVDTNRIIEGWGPWSIKDKTHHVQPPLEVLNQMVTFRLHLDDTDKNTS